jgi:hypothetical protein
MAFSDRGSFPPLAAFSFVRSRCLLLVKDSACCLLSEPSLPAYYLSNLH